LQVKIAFRESQIAGYNLESDSVGSFCSRLVFIKKIIALSMSIYLLNIGFELVFISPK
jgi:hypothetical protein